MINHDYSYYRFIILVWRFMYIYMGKHKLKPGIMSLKNVSQNSHFSFY